jgi:hypothetical protein
VLPPKWGSYLPPSQLYIVLGIVATACAIVSARLSKAPEPVSAAVMIGAPSRGGVVLVMLLLFIAATLATLPICVQIFILLLAERAGSDIAHLPLLLPLLHGTATVLLFLMAVAWCRHVTADRYTFRGV